MLINNFVIILDLHQGIMPMMKRDSNNNWTYKNLQEDVNLHYVSLTRAKKYVLLISSTNRTDSKGQVVNARVTEFISNRRDLNQYRKGNL